MQDAGGIEPRDDEAPEVGNEGDVGDEVVGLGMGAAGCGKWGGGGREGAGRGGGEGG